MTLNDYTGKGNLQIVKTRGSANRFEIIVKDKDDLAIITVTREGLEELRVMVNKELEAGR